MPTPNWLKALGMILGAFLLAMTLAMFGPPAIRGIAWMTGMSASANDTDTNVDRREKLGGLRDRPIRRDNAFVDRPASRTAPVATGKKFCDPEKPATVPAEAIKVRQNPRDCSWTFLLKD